jgi:hypothetical protein
LNEVLRLQDLCLGESDENLLHSAKVLVLSDQERRRWDQGLVLIAEFLGREARVLGGLEKVVGLADEERFRLDQDLVLSAA